MKNTIYKLTKNILRFEIRTEPVHEVRQDPVARILNPPKPASPASTSTSLTTFRNATKSPSPVSPAPPPSSTSMRRRSPSPVCTGNVSRVRSRFESGGSAIPSQPRVTAASSSISNQTLPKTFKLRESINPAEFGRFKPATTGINRFGGSTNHINEGSSKSRLTGSAKPSNPRDPVLNISPPPPRSKAMLERQVSVPDRPSPPPRFVPTRQMSHDLIQVRNYEKLSIVRGLIPLSVCLSVAVERRFVRKRHF